MLPVSVPENPFSDKVVMESNQVGWSARKGRAPERLTSLDQTQKPKWAWLKIKQEGLRRFWSMFPLTRATHFGIPVFGAAECDKVGQFGPRSSGPDGPADQPAESESATAKADTGAGPAQRETMVVAVVAKSRQGGFTIPISICQV